MKRSALLVGIIGIVLLSIYAAEAQSIISSVGDNIKSGALANSIGTFGKNTIFLWYTTAGGELDPQYDTQRHFIDGVLFFIIFLTVVRMSVSKIWKDMEKRSKEMMSLAIAAVLTISLLASGFSLGSVLRYINQAWIAIFGLLIGLLLNKITNKDNKPGKMLGNIVIGIIISIALLTAFNLLQGKSIGSLGGTFNTEGNNLPASRIISGGGSGDPGINYQLAVDAVKKYDYDKAKEYFEKVIAYGPANNPYYKPTAKWITPENGDLLFRNMAENYPGIMDAERAAAGILLDKAEALHAEGGHDEEIAALVDKADKYTKDVIAKETVLNAEIEKRKKA